MTDMEIFMLVASWLAGMTTVGALLEIRRQKRKSCGDLSVEISYFDDHGNRIVKQGEVS